MEFGVKRLVFSSSATVYGQPQYLPVDEKHPTGETGRKKRIKTKTKVGTKTGSKTAKDSEKV